MLHNCTSDFISDLTRNTAFERNKIPLDVLLFILFFIEGLINYHGILFLVEENEAVLHFCNSIVFSLRSGHITPSMDNAVLLSLLQALLRMNFISNDILSVSEQ